ncbi:antiterminator LoaP [Laceyella putida]|uniref:Transcription termination/antitermination protein NusG n=1 Tax=Laceyella putida TaxID=110101 RepID=A0ABW2RH42_9BACL
MNWYALFVKVGHEDDVSKLILRKLTNNIIRCIVPKRMIPEKKNNYVKHVLRPLFPGYVFIQAKMTTSLYYKLTDMKNIIRLLNHGYLYQAKVRQQTPPKSEKLDLDKYYFCDIPQQQMDPILKLIDKNEIIGYSQICLKGSKVIVNSGPLKNMEGIIKKVDKRKKRAKITMEFLGKTTLIDVGVEILQDAVKPNPRPRNE